MEFDSIQRSSTPQMIVEQILKRIDSRILKPGDKLPPERELTEMFGVGRSSIREAIRALVVMGHLEVIQGKGTFVKSKIDTNNDSLQAEDFFDAVSLFELMEAREFFECKVVELASERAENEHIKKMQKAIKRMEKSGDDIDDFFTADQEFHSAVAEAADNKVISEMMRLIAEKVYSHEDKLIYTSYEIKEIIIATTKQILIFLEEGEGKKAADYMRKHLAIVDYRKNFSSESYPKNIRTKSNVQVLYNTISEIIEIKPEILGELSLEIDNVIKKYIKIICDEQEFYKNIEKEIKDIFNKFAQENKIDFNLDITNKLLDKVKKIANKIY